MRARFTVVAGIFSFVALAFAVAACGDSAPAVVPDMAQAPADLAPAPPDLLLPDRDPTDHPPAATLDNFGGGTVAAMEPYTIVWQGDEALGTQVDTFMSWLVQSDYWVGVAAEYGGVKGTPKGVIVLDAAAPAALDDDAMDGIVSSLLSSGKIPAFTDNTVLFFVLPQTTKSTLFGSRGCAEYGGYHSETQTLVGGRHQPYAVNLQCAGSALNNTTGFDSLTVTLSHEAVEAQTDPHPFTAPGWVNQTSPLGGEVGDLCVFSNVTQMAADRSYLVTTVYSQVAAAAGNKEPCQPTPAGQPFFNVAVSPTNVVVTTDDNGIGDAQAQYQPFAYGDVGMLRWMVEQGPGQGIKITPSSGQAKAGETIRMTVHVGASARSGQYPLVLGVRSDKAGKNAYTATITVK